MKNINLECNPDEDCFICPRLGEFRDKNKELYPDFFNAPVPSFGNKDAKILITGLAPGLKGANRTGRPFTGDYAGDLLYKTLLHFNLGCGVYESKINDNVVLDKCRITNAVRCVPPQNKVTGDETNNCNKYLKHEINNMPNLKIIIALGTVAHGAVLKSLGLKKSAFKFAHEAEHKLSDAGLDKNILLIDSYHCSRYNTNTGRLTEEMFFKIFEKAKNIIVKKA